MEKMFCLGLALGALGGGFGFGEATAAEVLAVHAHRAAAAGRLVVEGAVVLEVGVDTRMRGGALQLLADNVDELVGAHRQRGAHGVEAPFGGAAGGLLEA